MSRSSAYTLGEALLGRRLEREKRAGTDHYVPGQMAATIDNEGTGWLGYVSAMGQAVLVICDRKTGHWEPRIVVKSGIEVCTGAQYANLLKFTLSQNMIDALNNAKKEE